MTMLKHSIILCCGVILIPMLLSCGQIARDAGKQARLNVAFPEGNFMGIEATDTPTLLFPAFINTPMGEYNGTFNSEGSEFFYTISNIHYDVLVHTVLQSDGTWSQPKIAPFSARYPEFDPLFSPEGQHLFFSSHRPIDQGASTDASHIWKVEKKKGSWGDAQLVPLEGPVQGNYFSSVTENGDLYFNIWNTGDLYKALKTDSGYVVESLDSIVNSPQGDGDPFVSPDGSFLIFRSYRPGGYGSGDLWISFNLQGGWKKPLNLGEPINSEYNEMCPYVTTDGKLFIFSSGRFSKDYYDEEIKDLSDVADKLKSWDNGQQNIYAMSADFIGEMRKEMLQASGKE